MLKSDSAHQRISACHNIVAKSCTFMHTGNIWQVRDTGNKTTIGECGKGRGFTFEKRPFGTAAKRLI